jgi:TetR/AcrR family tetracycline transcriptional repressor
MTGSAGQVAETGDAPARVALSPDDVVAAALAIVESEGLAALTMRRLASQLGVAVTAIYWHVGDKAALLDAVVDRIITALAAVPVEGDDPATRIQSVCRAWRRRLLEQPELVAVVHAQGRTAELFQPVRRVLVRELTTAGLGAHDAALALQAILQFVTGSVLTDIQVARAPRQQVAPEDLWTAADVDGAADLLDELRHPLSSDELFDYSVRRLVGAATGTTGP